MKILYLTQLVPYPVDAGAKVRMYHVLQHQAAAGHEVTLVCFKRDSDKPAAIAHLEQYCAAVHTVPMVRSRGRDIWHLGRSLLNGQPFLIARDSVDAMHKLLADLAAKQSFDIVQADQLWMAQYALKVLAHQNGSRTAKLVLDQHNAMFLIPERLAAGESSGVKRRLLEREAAVMAPYELDTCAAFDEVVWVTDDDREAFSPTAAGVTIPICIDPSEKDVIRPKPNPQRVTFLGGLHWPPNAEGVVWFAENVWPLVVAACPDACLTVIGKEPPAALTHPHMKNVETTGYVDDPTPYLAETAAFVVPLHSGGGMRVKILDAWAWGLPVVSTTIGAEGIQYTAGTDLLLADDAQHFAEHIIALLNDSALNAQLRTEGRKTVTTHYDWHTTYQLWEDVYRK